MPPSTTSKPTDPSRGRRSVYLLALAVVLAASSTNAQTVEAVGELAIEAAPGDLVTFAYRIVNPEDSFIDLIPIPQTPAGWVMLTGGERFTIGPTSTLVKVLSYSIPRNAAAGSFVVTYRLRSEDGSRDVAASDRHVEILPIDDLRLEVVELPKVILAGTTARVRFRLRNESNRAHAIHLQWTQSPELPVEIQPTTLDLAARESRIISLRIDSSEEILSETRYQLVLIAEAEPGAGIADARSIEFSILPRRAISPAKWNRLGGQLTLRGLVNDEGYDEVNRELNGTLALSGDIDDRDRRLHLFLQGPGTVATGQIQRTREELWAALTTPRWSLLVGDFDPRPSRLVSQPRGRGGRLAYRADRWTVGGHYLNIGRPIGPVQAEESALFGSYDVHGQSVGLQLLSRRHDDTGDSSEVLDLSAILRPSSRLFLRLGLAFGRTSSGAAEPQDGWSGEVGISGQQQSWSYNVSYLFGDDGFPGRYSGQSSLFGGVNANLTERWSLRTSSRRTLSTPEPDLVYTVYPIETTFTNSVHYRATRLSSLSVEHRREHREQVSQLSTVNLVEEAVRLSYVQSIPGGSLTARVDSGETRDSVLEATFDLVRFAIDASYRPSETVDLQASIEREEETSAPDQRETALSGLLRAKWQIGERWTFDTYLRRRERQFRTDTDATYAWAGVTRQLPKQQEISLTASRSRWTGEGRSRTADGMMVAYTMPLDVPVARRRNITSLQGTVRDELTGKPYADVVVRLAGAVARTDEDGEFSFPAVPVGTHPVTLQTDRIDYRLLPSTTNPAFVRAERAETNRLTLSLVCGGSIRGRVARRISDDERWSATEAPLTLGTAEEVLHPVAEFVVELSNGETTLRRITEADGTFVFEPLLPGIWTLRTVDATPPGFTVRYGQTQIRVDPGEQSHASIEFEPLKRRPRRLPSTIGDGAKLRAITNPESP